MKTLNEDLYNINENEYLAQQESTLEEALEMGLTEDEFNLIWSSFFLYFLKTPDTCFGIFYSAKVQF